MNLQENVQIATIPQERIINGLLQADADYKTFEEKLDHSCIIEEPRSQDGDKWVQGTRFVECTYNQK